MKILYKTLLSTMLISPLCVSAQQQIPNSGFEGDWVDCIPWTFYGNDDNFGQQAAAVSGINPTGWVVSNVSGMTSYYEGVATGLGATAVGDSVAGYNSRYAVELKNTPNPFMDTQIVPGYISLGTTWSTANPGFDFLAGGFQIKNSDGGSFGGIKFNERPTGIEFMYKRSRGEDKPAEKSTVVAYLWKGHWTQKDVPAIIYMAGNPYLTEMTDRDRCVLGMSMDGCQGGEVTKTDDAELIAVINAEITEDASEWTKFSAKFDYKSDATPEMINIIIAAGDYFGGASVVGKDNALTVDDVKLIYEDSSAKSYPGYLNVEMSGALITENQETTIEITPTGENKCTFVLPNLTLVLGGSPMPLGDIVVNDVVMTEADGTTTYTGEVKGMQLIGGAIIADVNLNGTITGNVINMVIDVMWDSTPIHVTFTSATSAISNIASDSNAAAEYFNLQGIRMNSDNLTPGIYVKRQGGKVSKVLVR
ncbi:MAG: PCMD domain-containing protein [Bacteroides sp.]|nr:PCMD domain-containing protein [Bacteroides sp.]